MVTGTDALLTRTICHATPCPERRDSAWCLPAELLLCLLKT
jgi:hypothetical protein